jgi:RNA polymerase sigma factor (sigma-70 family)
VSPARLDRRAETALRDAAPRVLGAVLRRFGDFAASEDAVQEALLAAFVQWPAKGVPANPAGWLYRVACRRMNDSHASEDARRAREQHAASGEAFHVEAGESMEQDDTLTLLFTCCHPALTDASAIALTLRAVGGLTTPEIARAFLVPEETMAQRISRAKTTIQGSGMSLEVPGAEERAGRLAAVRHVLYLAFNEGYVSSAGAELIRVELSAEAIRLTRALHRLVPEDTETSGLLALMLLTDARRTARGGPNGELIPLDEQDRSRWDRAQIDEGTAIVRAAFARGAVGSYQLQAAIAAVHDDAASSEDTDWPEILALYGVLRRMGDNPMVALSHAIAHAMVHGPEAGLARLDALAEDDRLAGHHRLDAVRAHLLERSGARDEAIALYRSAAAKTRSLPERDYLITRAARLAQ